AVVLYRSLVFSLLSCYFGHLKLIEPAILRLLLGYVFADGFGIPSNCINEETSGPNPLPSVISLSPQKMPRHVNRTLALDVSHDARYRQFRRHIDQHVHVIRHHMTFFLSNILYALPTGETLRDYFQHSSSA